MTTLTSPDGVEIPAALHTAIDALYAMPETTSGGAAHRQWAAQHRALIAGMEPARWETSRSAKVGTDHPRALFSVEEVVEIREAYAMGILTLAQLGELFECSARGIWGIVTGKSYSDVGGPRTRRGNGTPPPNRRLAS